MTFFELIDRATELARQYPDATHIELVNRLYSEGAGAALATVMSAVREGVRRA